MKLRDQAETTFDQICSSLNVSPTEDQKNEAVKIIEQKLIDTTVDAKGECADLAKDHSRGEDDAAHKIAKKIQRDTNVLIANLSSLR